MIAPCSKSFEPWASNCPLSTMRLGHVVGRAALDALLRQLLDHLAGVTSSSFARMAFSAGLLSRSRSATVSSGPSASHHMRTTHSGCEWRTAASAGVWSVSWAIRSLASREARRITALANRCPPSP